MDAAAPARMANGGLAEDEAGDEVRFVVFLVSAIRPADLRQPILAQVCPNLVAALRPPMHRGADIENWTLDGVIRVGEKDRRRAFVVRTSSTLCITRSAAYVLFPCLCFFCGV